MAQSLIKKDDPTPPYRWMALTHGLNYFLIAMLVGLAVLSGDWMVLAAGAAFEAAWVFLGSSLPPVRRSFDRILHDERMRSDALAQQESLRTLVEADRRRYLDLDRVRIDIHHLTEANATLTTSMRAGELKKLDKLMGSFLSIAATAARYEAYVESTDLNDLEWELKRQETVVDKTTEEEPRTLAKKNLELLARRLKKATEIRVHLRTARGQLNLIENTIRLLRDQIVTMESPEELTEQLDELVSSIDAIESSERETEALMRYLDPRPPSGSRG